MDSISEARLASICPELAIRVRKMAEMLAEEKIVIMVTQGLRTWDEQDRLYQQGRTAPGKIVTNAPAGSSYHNYGLAVDVCPDDPTLAGFQLDWNLNHPAWKRIVSIGESLGLVSGSEWRTFPDWPHFQLTGPFPTSPNHDVKELFRSHGMQSVWNIVMGTPAPAV